MRLTVCCVVGTSEIIKRINNARENNDGGSRVNEKPQKVNHKFSGARFEGKVQVRSKLFDLISTASMKTFSFAFSRTKKVFQFVCHNQTFTQKLEETKIMKSSFTLKMKMAKYFLKLFGKLCLHSKYASCRSRLEFQQKKPQKRHTNKNRSKLSKQASPALLSLFFCVFFAISLKY